MLNYSLYLLTFLLLSYNSYSKESCHFTSYEELLVINANQTSLPLTPFFISNHCDKDITTRLIQLLTNSKGKLQQRYIDEYFKGSLTIPLMSNGSINITQLNTLIKDNLPLKKKVHIFDLYHVSKKSILGFNKYTHLNIKCNNCYSLGSKTIFIEFLDKNNKMLRREMFNINLKLKTTALFPKNQMNRIGSKLNKSDFISKTIFTDEPERLSDIKRNIRFYKSNKPLSPITPLKIYDLTAIKLIQRGQMVRAYLNNTNINLSAMGKALESGTINQNIQLKINSKTVTAKVTGFNKVEIIQ